MIGIFTLTGTIVMVCLLGLSRFYLRRLVEKLPRNLFIYSTLFIIPITLIKRVILLQNIK